MGDTQVLSVKKNFATRARVPSVLTTTVTPTQQLIRNYCLKTDKKKKLEELKVGIFTKFV